MTRGFYNLSSSMMTQNRMLSAISNNIANVKTPGFKKSKILTKTFDELIINRIDGNTTPIGKTSMFRTADISATVHSQGTVEQTDRTLDFSITGQGFFAVQNQAGNTVYTRSGSFNVDNEGYLILQGVGRVLGENGPIRLGTDQVTADERGNIYNEKGTAIGKLALYDFADYKNLLTVGTGLFSGANATKVQNPSIMWKSVEGSNVNIGEELSSSIATQRVLQSVSQAIKMYDSTLGSAVTQIGRIN
ncbi:flagellar hook-basal body complex protein [Paludicola sp. MB14-C6]|uniref:flagellar hook-basal body protein n=1 Tax=Paludihabitans sp. MB14-C6 TaxID=3070656 RepID=UPI0027DE5C3C|nr:flagellar hook-basal body complex protein [Paludicola sp. MB14-C6]WMJ24230.1 flagellar hook-basal body complex protein [Paludicola sp. MB14-C6]